MENDNINKLFKDLEGSFDIETPQENHKLRFLEKLESGNSIALINEKRTFWKPLVAIAASVVLMISIFSFSQTEKNRNELASVSPEMATTQDFFTNTITEELETLNDIKSPETQKLVDDAIVQISILEKQYQNLKQDLGDSGKDKRVIYAMIANFQSRIDILQNVIQQIETIKQLNKINDEKSTTI